MVCRCVELVEELALHRQIEMCDGADAAVEKRFAGGGLNRRGVGADVAVLEHSKSALAVLRRVLVALQLQESDCERRARAA